MGSLKAILDWSQTHVGRSLHICWAAQAALRHFHGVPKHRLPAKRFGVFDQQVLRPDAWLLRGFGDGFPVPVSRHTEVRAADLPPAGGLTILAGSPEAGPCLVEDAPRRAVYMFNHLEYDADTLAREYARDRAAGQPIALPRNYFPEDDPSRPPSNRWRPYATLLFANWLAQLDREARPPVSDEPLLRWMLAEPRRLAAADARGADFLVAAGAGRDPLPEILRALADRGLGIRAVKAHREPGTILIELRTEPLDEAAAERTARRLGALDGVLRVAYRSGAGGAAGCVGGRRMRAVLNASGRPALRPAA